MDYKSKILDLLNSVSSDPDSLEMPTWQILVAASGKSKATLWRDKEIYTAYTKARNTKLKWKSIAKSKNSSYRKTLEQKIYFLQKELDEAKAIVNSHIVKFQEISQFLRIQGIDPVLVMGESPPVFCRHQMTTSG
ncbi:hypothetical protein [Pseudomonas anguilliseptica]|uniref:hypothetical protein n=1 Tax=Pseudomonas anguilliseptica TaxID=53406 RepID=UPI003734C82E